MDWSYLLSLVGIALFGVIVALFWRRRERRLTVTSETLRCPVHGHVAAVGVRTDPVARSGYRYRDVATCSLLPTIAFVPPARAGYFPDAWPGGPYVREASQPPCHASELACSKRCVQVLNAADRVVAPLQCTSGVADGLELARQTQSPAMVRQLWFHST